jgi:hypothetical protein
MKPSIQFFRIKECIKLFFTGSFLIVFCLPLLASQSEICSGVKGIWLQPNEKESPDFNWKARWIWLDDALDMDVMLARKTFHLNEIPNHAVLRITASSQYQLYINGQYVCRGPARCAPHHQSYDILEISGILKKGENLIAIRVHHQKELKSYQFDSRAGLLVQLNLDLGAEQKTLISDTEWKVVADLSWDNEAPKISRFNQTVNDRIDFRNYQKAWNGEGFDDSTWPKATALMRESGWPEPQKNAEAQPLTIPWTSLIPRDIPYLNEKEIRAENLVEARLIDISIDKDPIKLTGIKEIRLTGTDNEIPVSEKNKSWFLLYDFGEVLNGMPQLDIQGTAGTEVQIITAPFIVGNQFSKITVDSEFLEKIILSGERDRWEATYFKPTRYLGVIANNTEPLKLYSAGIHQIEYPFEKQGEMSSTDAPWIDKYFNATAKTINVCTTDAYTDNYRERRQYAQTGYYGALGNYWIYGDYVLQRRYLVQVAQEQLANGIMPAYAPLATDDFMIILDSNCLWIRSLRNYFLYSGDEETVRGLLPAAEKLMELLHSFTGTSGLLENPPYAYWLDHAVNDRRGANLTLNGHYMGALEDFTEVLNWLQMDNQKYQNRAKNLRSGLQLFWDNQRNLFADAFIDEERSEEFSEHAQAMALAMNLASPEQAKLVAQELLKNDNNNFIKRESGITMVTPAMSYFLHKGLCNYGFIDESFGMFRNRFDKMLMPETNGTLWEEWWLDGTGRAGKFQGGRTRSDAQTESAFPPALFAEFLLGVQPVKPGMKEIEIKRTNSDVKNVSGTIPTPEGFMKVVWSQKNNEGIVEIDVPGDIIIKVDLVSLVAANQNKVYLDGKTISVDKISNPYITLSKGNHKIKF